MHRAFEQAAAPDFALSPGEQRYDAADLSPKLSENIRQQVIIEIDPAETIIGTDRGALGARRLHHGAGAEQPRSQSALYPKIPYDAVKDSPHHARGASPLVVALHPSLPAKDVLPCSAAWAARPGAVWLIGQRVVGHMAVVAAGAVTATKFQHFRTRARRRC